MNHPFDPEAFPVFPTTDNTHWRNDPFPISSIGGSVALSTKFTHAHSWTETATASAIYLASFNG
jgi:hypothetical protein